MNDPIPWRRVLAEGVVIVGSILLALSADAWWDARKERRDERVALEQLHDEFSQNQESLRTSEAAHRAQRDGIVAMLEAIRERGSPPGSLSVPDSTLLRSLGYRTWDPSRGVLTSLITSGRLGLIRDDSLRVELASWLDAVEDLREDEIADGDFYREVVAILNDLIPLVSLDFRAGEAGFTGPSRFEPDYPAMLNSLRLENLLDFRLVEKNEILTQGYGPLQQRLIWILLRIENLLAG